jgi:ubiquinone/menaquinone biosynthesis C-methylase UbiE
VTTAVAFGSRARFVRDTVCRTIIIPLGVLLDGNRDLYHYLWQSVVEFDSVTRFADRLVAAGFEDVAYRSATGWQHGILHTFVARKPREKP